MERAMGMIDGMLQELEQEARTTRRVLERVPDAHLGWKPHEKSMSLGQLALHVAMVPGNVAAIAAQSVVQAPTFTQPSATSSAELVPAMEASVAKAKSLLGGMDDAKAMETWTLMNGERTVMAMPRA